MPGAFGNFFVRSIVNSPLHSLLGPGLAVISMRGRKTGRAITTPINVVTNSGGFTAISLRRRSWWRNLRGGAAAELRVAGQQRRVRAEVVEAPEAVAAGLGRYFTEHPELARYFGVQLGADHTANPADLQRLAAERVIIHLRPVEAA
jgi:hypothetical protein